MEQEYEKKPDAPVGLILTVNARRSASMMRRWGFVDVFVVKGVGAIAVEWLGVAGVLAE